jgi:hypothetical protein
MSELGHLSSIICYPTKLSISTLRQNHCLPTFVALDYFSYVGIFGRSFFDVRKTAIKNPIAKLNLKIANLADSPHHLDAGIPLASVKG